MFTWGASLLSRLRRPKLGWELPPHAEPKTPWSESEHQAPPKFAEGFPEAVFVARVGRRCRRSPPPTGPRRPRLRRPRWTWRAPSRRPSTAARAPRGEPLALGVPLGRRGGSSAARAPGAADHRPCAAGAPLVRHRRVAPAPPGRLPWRRQVGQQESPHPFGFGRPAGAARTPNATQSWAQVRPQNAPNSRRERASRRSCRPPRISGFDRSLGARPLLEAKTWPPSQRATPHPRKTAPHDATRHVSSSYGGFFFPSPPLRPATTRWAQSNTTGTSAANAS